MGPKLSANEKSLYVGTTYTPYMYGFFAVGS